MKNLRGYFAYLLLPLFILGLMSSSFAQPNDTSLVLEDMESFAGAIDESEFIPALNGWIQKSHAFIEQFKAASPQEADALFFDENLWDDLAFSQELERVQESIQPVFARWSEHWDLSQLAPQDSRLASLLESYGLKFSQAEGAGYLAVDEVFFANLFQPFLGQESRAYLEIQKQIPSRWFSDAALIYPLGEMGDWAILWENYLTTHSATDSPYGQTARNQYRQIMDILFFCDMDNTPAFPSWNKGKMEQEWMQELQAIAAKHADSQTAGIILGFLQKIKADGYTLSATTKKDITAQISAVPSASSSSSSAPSKKLTTAESKLLGQHLFSLQWISWEKFGTAIISQKEDGLYIDAKQELDGNYVTLQGKLKVISDLEFTVQGELTTCVDHINNGLPCQRNETFTFKASEKKKYWRLQEMHNPCEGDNLVDYVDIFF